MRPEDRFDEILAQIRNEQADASTVEAAGDRVWARLSQAEALETTDAIRGCADFRKLIPAYRAGRLSKARAMLLEDHSHECVACRKALLGAREPVVRLARPPAFAWFRWAFAACLTLVTGLAAWSILNRWQPRETAGRVLVQAIDGGLYQVSGEETRALRQGEELTTGAPIRVAKDSGAVLRLADGSRVEMRERTALWVDASGKDLTVRLSRGSIIVQAARRRTGKLYVAASDCRVAVTGTVFSVDTGVKGSRVSVIEGEVRVAQGGKERVLRPGDQYLSRPGVQPVPVREEIAWSRNREAHIALLREFAALEREMKQVRQPGLRYTGRLLAALPRDTAVYAAIPNLGEAIGESYAVFQRKLRESAVLRQWWEQRSGRGKPGSNLDEIVAEVRHLSDYLGEEIVIAATAESSGKLGSPVLLAELKRPGLREYLQTKLQHTPPMAVRDGIVAISPEAGALAAFGTGGFAGTPFHARIEAAYSEGIGLLLGADMEKIRLTEALEQPRCVIVEQREIDGKTDTRAVLTFDGQRRGPAAWLAPPAPMGALDFISPDATVLAAFAVADPATALDELLASRPEFGKALAEVESKLGLRVRDDVAAALGGEFAFAIEGAALPTPGWKLVVEVYSPAKLQWAIQKVVAETGQAHLNQETIAGRTWYKIAAPGAAQAREIHYVYADGYLVAAPSRELLERALQNRASGITIASAETFASLLPRSRHNNFSAVAYYNLPEALGLKPILVAAYGGQNRITLATSSEHLRLSTASLFGIGGPMSMMRLLEAERQ